jgi:hypothetical protein
MFCRLSLTASLLLGLSLAGPAFGQPNDPDDTLPSAPVTIRAVGTYTSSLGGEAVLDMSTATSGRLRLGAKSFTITADATAGTFQGTSSGNIVSTLGHTNAATSTITLTVPAANANANANQASHVVAQLTGTLDGKAITLDRVKRKEIPADEASQSDEGPTGDWKSFFDSVPDYKSVLQAAGVDPNGKMFWYNFGPVFYRGRLDGTARVMVIASDPGPEECLPFVRHPMVGDAGQRVQGFLAKLGLAKSYILVNAYANAMRPSYVKLNYGKAIITEDFTGVTDPVTQQPVVLTDEQKAELHKITVWRNEFFTRVARTNKLQAIIAMGGNAHPAYDGWIASLPADDPIRKIPVIKVQHPSAIDRDPSAPRPDAALLGWQKAITRLRAIVTPDPGQSNKGLNYGDYFTENDYARIPRWDLPAHAPSNIGDNAESRNTTGVHNDAKRPAPDDRKTLVYNDPKTGKAYHLVYLNGVFHPELTTDDAGEPASVDEHGVPTQP